LLYLPRSQRRFAAWRIAPSRCRLLRARRIGSAAARLASNMIRASSRCCFKERTILTLTVGEASSHWNRDKHKTKPGSPVLGLPGRRTIIVFEKGNYRGETVTV